MVVAVVNMPVVVVVVSFVAGVAIGSVGVTAPLVAGLPVAVGAASWRNACARPVGGGGLAPHATAWRWN